MFTMLVTQELRHLACGLDTGSKELIQELTACLFNLDYLP